MIRVNLLGVPRAKRRRVRAPIAIAPGGGLALGLLIGAIVVVAGVQLWRYRTLQSEGAQLQEQIQVLEREKAELAQVQAQYEEFSRRKELLTARINVIEQLKAQQSGPVLLLNTLANSVSSTDSVWLTTFQKTGERISINGVALTMRSVADLITRLMNSGTFRELDLRESAQDTTRDFTSFNFTLEAQLTPLTPAPPPPPPAQPGAA
jgi:type IV pilus assembly protein PilN